MFQKKNIYKITYIKCLMFLNYVKANIKKKKRNWLVQTYHLKFENIH